MQLKHLIGRSNTQHGWWNWWFKETIILGVSYSLYGIKCKDKKNHGNIKERKENGDMRKVLLKGTGLLVLDDGHRPRNQSSQIWKVLSKIQVQKWIILSWTPFQNNLWELYSTLSLLKHSFPNTIRPELKSFCHKQGHKSSKKWSCEPVSGNTTRDPFVPPLKISFPVFVCDFAKRGLVLIITSEIELEISRPLWKGFYRKKSLKKGHEMHSGCLESRTGLIVKGTVSRQIWDCN